MTCSSLFPVLVPQSPSYGRQGELKRVPHQNMAGVMP